MNKNGVLNRRSRSVFIVRLSFGFMFVMIVVDFPPGTSGTARVCFNSEPNRATWNDREATKMSTSSLTELSRLSRLRTSTGVVQNRGEVIRE